MLEAQRPRAVEQLTEQLTGAQLHQVLVAEKTCLWFDRWFNELVSATESQVREQANGGTWEAPFRLLHGLAAIGSPSAAQTALAAANRLRKLIGRVPGQDPGPRSPLEVRRLQADGDVVRLRDVWGTRYAVIAEFSYGGRPRATRRTVDQPRERQPHRTIDPPPTLPAASQPLRSGRVRVHRISPGPRDVSVFGGSNGGSHGISSRSAGGASTRARPAVAGLA